MEIISWSLRPYSESEKCGGRENMFNRLKCRYKGHILKEAGTCPYTGSTYDYCKRCTAMIPRQIAE